MVFQTFHGMVAKWVVNIIIYVAVCRWNVCFLLAGYCE